MAMKIFLYDTTVFIDYFRGKKASLVWMDPIIKGNNQAAICLITDQELWAGAKNEEDKKSYNIILSSVSIVQQMRKFAKTSKNRTFTT